MEYQKDAEECLEELKELQKSDDQEIAHIEADGCLIKFLCAIGYCDIAYEYDQISKWYA